MEKKKSKKILIILIVFIIILILLIGVAIAYFATDMFKSNKTLFFKYAGQIVEQENSFVDTKISQYYNKIGSTPYTDNGTISAEVSNSNLENKQLELVNDFNISFSGEVDIANSKSKQDMSINYSDNVNFPVNYKQIDSTIGLQTKYINDKYIALDFSESTSLENGLMDSVNLEENIESIEKLTKIPFTQEELEQIKEKYIDIINTQLKDSQFSKVNENNQNGYKLTLTGEELKNLEISLLEALKNDQTTLDKLNEYLANQANSSEITSTTIDGYIENINKDTQMNEENLEIIVFVNNGLMSKIQIKNNTDSIIIEKIINTDVLQYNIGIEINESESGLNKIDIVIAFNGLDNMEIVKENYEIGLTFNSLNSSYKYKYQNTVAFTETSNIEEFSDENSMILNDYESEQVSNFMNAVVQRIMEVNKKNMEDLGVAESENPMQYLIPTMQSSLGQSNDDMFNNSEILDLEVESYNQKFQMYESTNLQGTTVKGLLTVIQSVNESDDDKKITEINFNGEEYDATDQNLTLIKGEVGTDTAYRVEFEMNENTGAIFRAVINQK